MKMKLNLPKIFVLGFFALGAAVLLSKFFRGEPETAIVAVSMPELSSEASVGQILFNNNCASCHGASLEGQPDWRRRLDTGRMPAPPHDDSGHTWHHSDRMLFQITKGGVGAVVPGYESDMPAFAGLLSDDEVKAVLAYIKTSWSERERGFQAEVSAGAESSP